MPAVNEVSGRDFESALAAHDRVLVDFSASWCGPCKAMAPVLESFAAKRPDLSVVKLDIDEAPSIASRYSIRSVPTLMLFKDGKPVASQAGMVGEAQLARFVGDPPPRTERPPVEQDPDRPQIKLDW
jgi:thioredoxin 1